MSLPGKKDEELDLESLKRGDVVQNLASGNCYVIIAKVNGELVAIRSITVTNPSEWKKIS